MPFIDELRDIQNKVDTSRSQSDLIFEEILTRSNQLGIAPAQQYNNLNAILSARDAVTADINAAGLKEDVSLIGNLTEMICEIAIKAVCDSTRYSKLPRNWKWLGDFAITGLPFNLYVSVKSYYAKERLIVSGTGQMAAPVVGYGLFKDISEWKPRRVNQYRHRGFIAIYIPTDLYNDLASQTDAGCPVTDIENIYAKPLLRDIANFSDDLRNVFDSTSSLLKIEDF